MHLDSIHTGIQCTVASMTQLINLTSEFPYSRAGRDCLGTPNIMLEIVQKIIHKGNDFEGEELSTFHEECILPSQKC